MRTKFALPAVLALALSVSLAATASEATAPHTAKLGQPAPNFTLPDQTGKPVSLADYAGKVVVLAWFNRDCPFVQRHLHANTFNTLQSKYADKGVVLLAIDSTHNHSVADDLKATRDFNLNFPLLNDANGAVGHQYNAKTTPDMFVINKDGTLVYSGAIDNNRSGDQAHPTNYVDQALSQLLANQPISTPETKSYGCSVKYAR